MYNNGPQCSWTTRGYAARSRCARSRCAPWTCLPHWQWRVGEALTRTEDHTKTSGRPTELARCVSRMLYTYTYKCLQLEPFPLRPPYICFCLSAVPTSRIDPSSPKVSTTKVSGRTAAGAFRMATVAGFHKQGVLRAQPTQRLVGLDASSAQNV